MIWWLLCAIVVWQTSNDFWLSACMCVCGGTASISFFSRNVHPVYFARSDTESISQKPVNSLFSLVFDWMCHFHGHIVCLLHITIKTLILGVGLSFRLLFLDTWLACHPSWIQHDKKKTTRKSHRTSTYRVISNNWQTSASETEF